MSLIISLIISKILGNIILGYVRVSSREQINGTGIERQINAIETFAEHVRRNVRRSRTELRTFVEKGISGTVEKRPAFSEMIAYADANDCKIIIIEDMTRLARELLLQMQLATFIASKEIDLYSANTGENISKAIYDDPMRKAMIQMQGVFSELERSTMVKRMIGGRKIQHETGMRNGKRIEARDRKGKIRIEGRPRLSEINPELALRVIELHKKGKTLYGTAKILNQEGFKSSTGGLIYHTQVAIILKDWRQGVFNTTKALDAVGYQDE